MDSKNNTPVKLLWTGGWDSTFRLCELLFVYKRTIQPYYLIDPNRKSTQEEFLAQKRIKDAIIEMDSGLANMILPTKYYNILDYEIDPVVENAFDELMLLCPFGTQYKWLPNFCCQKNIANLELSAEKVEGHIRFEFLKNFMVSMSFGNLPNFKINRKMAPTSVTEIFHYFLFPLHDKTRNDMHRIASSKGFLSILYLTWFCHEPIRSKPCGHCNPCVDVVKYGYGNRLGALGQIRFQLRRLRISAIKKKTSIFVKL